MKNSLLDLHFHFDHLSLQILIHFHLRLLYQFLDIVLLEDTLETLAVWDLEIRRDFIEIGLE